jgi:hypothetical protein
VGFFYDKGKGTVISIEYGIQQLRPEGADLAVIITEIIAL